MRLSLLSFLLAGALSLPFALMAQDRNHDDAFRYRTHESALAERVRHQLVMLPYYSVFDDLAFQVEDGKLILLGDVTQPVLKSDAGNAVKQLEGVSQVDNRINVLPVSDFDWQIRRAEFRAIYGDPEIGDRYGHQALPQIHIIVNNGHVKLEGLVANQVDKTLIDIRAKGVANVFAVEDDLEIAKS